jgi:predicted DsbA family dithiol-disulfide isomerase
MPNFQVFFEYECPFCKSGLEVLMELLPAYSNFEIEWLPIESHPLPENHRPHTDLCVQAHYIVEELKSDMGVFRKAMFQAVAAERRDVEKADVIADILKGIVDRESFLKLLESGKYASKPDENNDLAYKKNGVWYVPAFRIPGSKVKLDAKGGVGVSREEIKAFLDKAEKG